MSAKIICPRGGLELDELSMNHFTFELQEVTDRLKFTYSTQGNAKCNNASTKSREKDKLKLPVSGYSNTVHPYRCFIWHLQERPRYARPGASDLVFLQPIQNPRSPQLLFNVPLSQKARSGLASNICARNGFTRKTNHSGRSTGITEAGKFIDVTKVAKRSNHASISSVMSYDRMNDTDLLHFSDQLHGAAPKTTHASAGLSRLAAPSKRYDFGFENKKK